MKFPIACCLTVACALPMPGRAGVSFNDDIRPIFQHHCTACHGGIKASGGISFVYRERAVAAGKSGLPAIVPGRPDESELIRRVESDDPDERMPKPDHGPKLGAAEVAALREWIRAGAVWEEHWAFVLPQEPPEPELPDPRPAAKIDRLVLAAMLPDGLSPSPEAPLSEWLRRASFDLTGLPPQPEDLARLEREAEAGRDAAMAAAVDRLLASPHFGERWATVWLDLARYADTTGFEKDPHRNIWPYRDWVIRAFNADMPFDDFTRRQIAGDLLPNPEPGDLIATAFHRNTQNNTEGGTDDEEFRMAAVIDRVNTTWTAWTGTTFGCVQCHDHPYDPIPHRDYYRFMAFFNNSEDADLNSEFPLARVADDPAHQAETLQLEREIRSSREALNDSALDVAKALAGWEPLAAASATASADTGAVTPQADGVFVSSGTHPNRSTFTVTAPATRLAALRIAILPMEDDPARWIERGAVITKLEADLVLPDGTRQPVKWREIVSDFLAGPLEPNGIIDGRNGGIGDFPALHGPRTAVAVPESVVDPPAGSQLELRLHQSAVCNAENQSCVLRKFSLETTADPSLTEFAATPERAAAWAAHRDLEAKLQAIPGIEIPVMLERPDAGRRDTRVFHRGNRTDRGEPVNAGIPEIAGPPAHNENLTRLDLAAWLTSPANPLTARVLANRLWQSLFGTGIVETAGDFGSSGALPSNQPLLDHLALRLSVHHAWHIKPFLRELALSATYRQSSRATPDRLAKDPANRLLSRGPRLRLTAEMVRDQALVASGLFAPQMFGPPVFPPQPEGIWRSVYNSEKWTDSTGSDRYRRAIYTYVKRTSGYPSFLTFDAPARDVCTARRIPTNTPLQALVTLNDPAFLELAQAFAKRMAATGGDVPSQIASGFERLLLRPPSSDTLAALASLHRDALTSFTADSGKAAALGSSPDEAALVVVAATLFNMDAALTR